MLEQEEREDLIKAFKSLESFLDNSNKNLFKNELLHKLSTIFL